MYNGREVKIPISEFIGNSSVKVKKKLAYILRLLADETNLLQEPHVKHFSIEKYKRLYEIRLKAEKIMVRIIYYEANKNIILLYAFVKRDKRDTERALEYSLKLIEKLDKASPEPFEQLTEVKVN